MPVLIWLLIWLFGLETIIGWGFMLGFLAMIVAMATAFASSPSKWGRRF